MTLTYTLNFKLGTPLEIFDQKDNVHSIASKIEAGEFIFNLPKGKILDRSEFKHENKKGNLFIRKATNPTF